MVAWVAFYSRLFSSNSYLRPKVTPAGTLSARARPWSAPRQVVVANERTTTDGPFRIGALFQLPTWKIEENEIVL